MFSSLPKGLADQIYSPDAIAAMSFKVRIPKTQAKAVDTNCSSQLLLCQADLLEAIQDGR